MGGLPKLLIWWSYVDVWPFLGQGQICFPMHLYGPCTFTCICEKCWEFVFWTFPLKTMIQLSLNVMRSISASSRHKIAKTEPIENLKMATTTSILKINFPHLFPNPWSVWVETCSVATGQLLDWNELKSCWSEIQVDHHSRHLEKLFWTSSCKPQGQLSWNLQCSNRFTYKWKMAKIMPIRNPKWPP